MRGEVAADLRGVKETGLGNVHFWLLVSRRQLFWAHAQWVCSAISMGRQIFRESSPEMCNA